MKRNQLLTASALFQFALFVPLAWWASKHEHHPVDVAVTRILQKRQSSCMRSLVSVLNTVLCSAVVLNMLAVPVAMLLWKMRLQVEALLTVGTCWTSALVRTGIKRLVDRSRPSPFLVHVTQQSHGKSFPSGHVTSCMGLWGWLFALGLLHKQGRWPVSKLLLGLTVLPVVLVGPARVYLGEHWATDVLGGGYLFGCGWLSLTLRLYLALRKRTRHTRIPEPDTSRLWLSHE